VTPTHSGEKEKDWRNPFLIQVGEYDRYLDPSQIRSAESLAKFTAKIGRLPPNRTLTEGITLFLKALCETAADRMVADWTKEFVDKTPIEYILTVPAVWSDKSKNDTLKCAVDAGFCSGGVVTLITEPEAAAVYTFTTVGVLDMSRGCRKANISSSQSTPSRRGISS
jgi:hypothetical protein